MLKKIVVIGPESTGKSALCTQLAQHYKTLFVPEFAREYLEQHGTNYTFEELLIIAKKQVALEDEYNELNIKNSMLNIQHSTLNTKHLQLTTHNSPLSTHHSPLTTHHHIAIGSLLFIDTDMYVMKMWCEFVFNKCHNWILDQIAGRTYGLYLLCNVDLPWVKDNLREYPDLERRAKLYHYYKDIMINQQTPWVDINGNYQERFNKAVKAIDFLTA